MLRLALTILIGACTLASPSYAGDDIKTVYLVRHAEKQATKTDPQLTPCGNARAKALAKQLTMIPFDHVFSTKYQRTIATATPLATSQNQDITFYNPRELNAMADEVKKLSGNILIVGHSNTTPVLAGLLVGESLKAFDESIYDRLYQVTLINGVGKLQILKQGFECRF